MAENVSALLNFPAETFRQTLDQLHRRASSLVDRLASVNSAIRERAGELHSAQESVELALQDAENREIRLDEKERESELEEGQIEENRKGFDGEFEDLELTFEKNECGKLCEEAESKQRQQIKEVNHGYRAIIDGKALQIYLNEHSGEVDSMIFAVSMALGHSSDPSMLVLDALQGFYPPYLKKGGIEFEGEVVRRSCSVILEELMKFSPQIQPSVKEEARRIASDWVSKLNSNAEHSLEVLCFLQLLACYGLVSSFDSGMLLAQLEIVSNHSLAPLLFRALGFTNEVSDFSHKLVEKKKLNEAIKFIYEFEMFGQFQPISLLNDFLGEDVLPEEQICPPEKRLANIKYALRCIEEYKIDYGPAHKILEEHVGFLENEISKRNEAAFLGDETRKSNDEKQHQKENLGADQYSIKIPEQEISENKHPRTDAAIGIELNASHGVNQVRSDVSSASKEELKKLLEMCENEKINDGEIAAALRSSHNPEKLVLDIMNVPIPFMPSGFKDFEVKSSWILLLKQLKKVVPEINPEIRDEAKKFALHLEPMLRTKSNKSPLEAICFLQFLASFKLGLAFFSHELLGLLETDHWHKEAPDLCDDLGLTDKIPSFIQNQINQGKCMEAVKYIYALNMVDMFNPAWVLKTHLINSLKNSGMGSLEEQIEGIEKESKAHEEVFKCVADYKITGLSPEKLKERIVQLEKEKQELITGQQMHTNKRHRTRVLSENGQSWNGGSSSATPLQYPPVGQDVVFSPFRQHVRPAYYPHCETELNGYAASVRPDYYPHFETELMNGASIRPAYPWNELGNFGPVRPFYY